MAVFTEDEGLLPVFLQVRADIVRGGIHFRFDIGDLPQAQGRIDIVHLVVALIMHGTGGIQALQFPAHLQDHRSGQALVAAGPDDDAGMVPVPAHHGADPVQEQRLPGRLRAREHLVLPDESLPEHVPHAVAFHVVLVDDVQAQLVAEAVKGA